LEKIKNACNFEAKGWKLMLGFETGKRGKAENRFRGIRRLDKIVDDGQAQRLGSLIAKRGWLT